MVIARKGKFTVRNKTYLGGRKRTLHDIDICEDLDDNSCYVIAEFVLDEDAGSVQVVELADRVDDAITSYKDWEDYRAMVKVGRTIIENSEDRVEDDDDGSDDNIIKSSTLFSA